MSFDSRMITYLNCYAKKLPRTGRIEYRLATGPGLCQPDDTRFVIEVKEKAAGEGQQHDVVVRMSERKLVADPPTLEVRAGDMVLWHAADASVAAFSVRGTGPGGSFDSARMEDEAVFTHAFGSTGTYAWADAYGGGARGVVEVVEPKQYDDADCEEWTKALGEGALFHIAKGKVQPDRVRIVPGQTVFWAIEGAPGISITDTRLLPEKRGDTQREAKRGKTGA